MILPISGFGVCHRFGRDPDCALWECAKKHAVAQSVTVCVPQRMGSTLTEQTDQTFDQSKLSLHLLRFGRAPLAPTSTILGVTAVM